MNTEAENRHIIELAEKARFALHVLQGGYGGKSTRPLYDELHVRINEFRDRIRILRFHQDLKARFGARLLSEKEIGILAVNQQKIINIVYEKLGLLREGRRVSEDDVDDAINDIANLSNVVTDGLRLLEREAGLREQQDEGLIPKKANEEE